MRIVRAEGHRIQQISADGARQEQPELMLSNSGIRRLMVKQDQHTGN